MEQSVGKQSDVEVPFSNTIRSKKNGSNYSKRVHQLPSLNRNEIKKMQTYAMEELNPIMSVLLRNLVISRPRNEEIEDEAISNLSDIKIHRLNKL